MNKLPEGLVDLAHVEYKDLYQQEKEDELKYFWLFEIPITEEQGNVIAKRLAELWKLRDITPSRYVKEGFGYEKEAIYTYYGDNNKVMWKAKQIYNAM